VLSALVASPVFAGHLLWRRRRPITLSMRSAVLDVAWVTAGFWLFVMAGAIAGEMVYA